MKSLQRAERAHMAFTDRSLRQLNITHQLEKRLRDINAKRDKAGRKRLATLAQMYIWDQGSDAPLALLIGAGGAKTFRTTFKWNGQWVWATLGRFPTLTLADARRMAEEHARAAQNKVDPRQQANPSTLTYGAVLDRFVEHYCKPRQRWWDEVERVLRVNCKGWLGRPIADITRRDAYQLLDRFKADGHPYKAARTLRWLATMWRWAWKRDYVSEPIMERVEFHFENNVRDRVYSNKEIATIWKAACTLDATSQAYIKLLLLLAPRKTALALMRWADLDDPTNPTVWTTPHELVKARKTLSKKRRVYVTPLPALAQR